MRRTLGWFSLLAAAAIVTWGQPGGAAGHVTAGQSRAQILLSETVGGGFVPVQISFAQQLPRIAVYSDGRIFRVDPSSIGDAVVTLGVRVLAPAELRRVVALARSAGVTSPAPDLGRPSVSDLPSTTFTLVDRGRATTVSAYALSVTDGLTAGQAAARRRLIALDRSLQRIATGAGAGAPAHRYLPRSLSVGAQPAPGPLTGHPRAWPLGTIRPSCFGVTDPAEVRQILSLAAHANAGTVWTSGTRRWQLSFRPDLPGERPCD